MTKSVSFRYIYEYFLKVTDTKKKSIGIEHNQGASCFSRQK